MAKGDDFAYKGNIEYRIDQDKLIYATYSEGFRSGGVNRARVPGIPKYQPDFVYNYEIGWKLQPADGRLRFNGAAYLIDWKHFQFSFLDFSVSNITVIQNGPSAQTKGAEWDLTWAMNDNNTVTFSGSYNDAKLKEGFWIDSDPADGGPPNAPKGTPMPYVPKWQMTGIWRSNFNIAELPMFFQAAVSYTDKQWNSLDVSNSTSLRQPMDDYSLTNLSAGIEKENWTLSFYVNNLFDKRAQLDILDPGYGRGLPGYGGSARF